MAIQDYYDDQRWKEYPGIANVILWCVHAIEVFAHFSLDLVNATDNHFFRTSARRIRTQMASRYTIRYDTLG